MNYRESLIIAASIGMIIAILAYIYSIIKPTYKKKRIEQYKLMNYASNFLEQEIIYIQLLMDDKEIREADKKLLSRFLEEYKKDFEEIQREAEEVN
ncbi:MAG: hypothetical protein HXL86_04915 [[Eubacterium] sulci]|nr:hypothetical protein [[Eubacterium] sulci]